MSGNLNYTAITIIYLTTNMELNIEGSNPAPAAFSKVWMNGLIQHMKQQAVKYRSQQKYSEAIGINPSYVSLVLHGKGERLGRNALMKVAVASGFESHHKEIPRKPRGTERVVEFENDQSREREEPVKPKRKDLDIIEDYIQKRSTIGKLPAEVRPDYVIFLLNGTIKKLESVTAEEVC